MKQFLKKLILLTLCLTLPVVALNWLAVQAGSVYKDGAAFVGETKRKAVRSGKIAYKAGKENLLVMGTSRIMAGFKPLLFDQLNNGKTVTVNLALPALPIGPYYFMLKDYLEKNPPPQQIILELKRTPRRKLGVFNRYAAQGASGIMEIFTYFRHLPGSGVMMNYLFPVRLHKYGIPRYVVNRLFRPGVLKQDHRRTEQIMARVMASRGYYFITEQALFPDLRLPEGFGNEKNEKARAAGTNNAPHFDPFTDPFVTMFFDLAAAEGIPVLLIQPAFRVGEFIQFEEMPRQYRLILERYSNVKVAPGKWKAKFYENRFFADLTHLNPKGADRFTRDLFEEYCLIQSVEK